MILIGFSLLVSGCSQKVVEKPVYIEKPVVVEKPVYIKPKLPPLPKRPELERVEFKKVGRYYCLTKEEAKTLLKNIYKLDNYARELEGVLEEIR